MKKPKIPKKLLPWVEARRRFRLSHAQVQMARELGLNPRKLGSLANSSQQAWKVPLPQFIEQLYRKRFGRAAPELVRSLEQLTEHEAARQQAKRERRLARKAADGGGESTPKAEGDAD